MNYEDQLKPTKGHTHRVAYSINGVESKHSTIKRGSFEECKEACDFANANSTKFEGSEFIIYPTEESLIASIEKPIITSYDVTKRLTEVRLHEDLETYRKIVIGKANEDANEIIQAAKDDAASIIETAQGVADKLVSDGQAAKDLLVNNHRKFLRGQLNDIEANFPSDF